RSHSARGGLFARQVPPRRRHLYAFFIIIAPPPTPLYPLSLHDALPIYFPATTIEDQPVQVVQGSMPDGTRVKLYFDKASGLLVRSEEHTSELQSHLNLVCRLLLEKKNDTATEMRAETTAGPRS